MPVVEESHEWIDVRSASSTPRNDLIRHDRNWIFDIVERAIWLDDKSKRKLRLLEERMSSGYRVECGSDIFRRAICEWRRSYTGLQRVVRATLSWQSGELTFAGRIIGGGG